MAWLANPPAMMSLHNHTNFSDGSWSPAEVMEAAAEMRLKAVGITDHFAATHVNAVMPDFLANYVGKVRDAAAQFAGRIEVFVGAELHASPKRTVFEQVDPAALADLDYLIVEYVADENRSGMPFWEFIEYRKRIPCHVGLAHTDAALLLGHVEARELAELLKMEKIFLELNTNKQYSRLGKQFYRHWPELFREVGRAEGELSIGTDVHSRLADVGNVSDAEEFARSVGAEGCFERCVASIRKRAGQRNI
ncbi:MAG: PHP domain-containing protein [Methanobacteriota archaeon]